MKPKAKIDLETLSIFIVLVILTVTLVLFFKIFLFGPDSSLAEMATH